MEFTHYSDIPQDRKRDITYGRLVVENIPQKRKSIGQDWQ